MILQWPVPDFITPYNENVCLWVIYMDHGKMQLEQLEQIYSEGTQK